MKNGKQSMTTEHSIFRCEMKSFCEGPQRQGAHHCLCRFLSYCKVLIGSNPRIYGGCCRFVSIKDTRPGLYIPPLIECNTLLMVSDGDAGKSTCYPFKQPSMFNHLKRICAQNITTDVSKLGVVFLVLGSQMPNLSVNRSCSYWLSMHTFILL